MKYLSTLLALAVVGTYQVRADYLNWTYIAKSDVPGVSVNTPTNGGATVTLTDFGSPKPGGTSVPVQAYITVTSSTTPISFNNSSFNLAMKITDANNASGTLNFSGSLNGALSATTSSVVASFTSDAITFDGHTYTVNIPSITLAPPTSSQQNIMASVSVTNATDGGSPSPTPPPQGTPEPTSLLLSGLGVSGLGVGYWCENRRQKRKPAEVELEKVSA